MRSETQRRQREGQKLAQRGCGHSFLSVAVTGPGDTTGRRSAYCLRCASHSEVSPGRQVRVLICLPPAHLPGLHTQSPSGLPCAVSVSLRSRLSCGHCGHRGHHCRRSQGRASHGAVPAVSPAPRRELGRLHTKGKSGDR